MTWLVVLAACGGAGCGDDDVVAPFDAGGGGADAGATPDAAIGVDAGSSTVDAGPIGADAGLPRIDAGTCTTPAIVAPAWLEDDLRAHVGTLAGDRDVVPGVRLRERSTVASRDRAREYLRAALAALGAGLTVEVRDYGSGANIVATLPATTRPGSSRIVLGAHFDGVRVGPAAADNGTGCALVVAAARWIVESFPCRTRDLEFVLFDEEELGLVGSGVYATALLADSVPTIAVHSFDMISWDMNGNHTIELWLADPTIRSEWQAAAAAHAAAVIAVRFRGSDHTSFADRGIPVTGICEEFTGGDTSPYYHTAEDTFDKINFPFLAQATTIAVDVVARELAR